jgi:hypothetical protein
LRLSGAHVCPKKCRVKIVDPYLLFSLYLQSDIREQEHDVCFGPKHVLVRRVPTIALGRQIVRKPNFVIPDNQRLAVGEQVSMPKSA